MSLGGRSTWTYGAEHELSDWPRHARALPAGWKLDERDVTMVNSNGIAVDPRGITYDRGGEFNTPPTANPEGQAALLAELLRLFPECTVNYRSNLHLHVRIPGLREDLAALKQIARFNAEHLPRLLQVLEPIPRPTRLAFPAPEELEGALRRYRRRLVSHHTVVRGLRLAAQLAAATTQEFFEREVPWSESLGRPQWQCQPRQAVNLRQLRETDTVEFRHFPGTLDPAELATCARWCGDYLACALRDGDPMALFHSEYDRRPWPQFPAYVHWMEVRYRATVHDGTLSRAEIERNTALILAGEFRP